MAHKFAAALKYDGQGAPVLVAKGQGMMAEKILALARQSGVPSREDADLAALLAALELNSAIPEELYGACAKLLAAIWIVRQTAQSNEEPRHGF